MQIINNFASFNTNAGRSGDRKKLIQPLVKTETNTSTLTAFPDCGTHFQKKDAFTGKNVLMCKPIFRTV